jgi:hypothetical protein
MHCSLCKFAVALNSLPLFWKLLSLWVPAQYIREYSMSVLLVKTLLPLDALHLIMLFVRTLAYLESKLFLLTIIYSCTSSLLIITILKINVHTYISSYRIMVGVTALSEWFLSKWHTLPCSVFSLCVCVCFLARAYFTIGLQSTQ